MVANYIVHMYIIVELTAYWLAFFTCIYSNVVFIYNGTYICNVEDILAQGQMSLM